MKNQAKKSQLLPNLVLSRFKKTRQEKVQAKKVKKSINKKEKLELLHKWALLIFKKKIR